MTHRALMVHRESEEERQQERIHDRETDSHGHCPSPLNAEEMITIEDWLVK